MQSVSLLLSTVLCVVLLPLGGWADVKLAAVFSDNMVLQRQQEVPVWGQAHPGADVVVAFDGQVVKSQADAKGRWRVALSPMAAQAEGRDVMVRELDAEGTLMDSLTLTNVLVGEVWLCSGQSNMEWSLGGSAGAQDIINTEAFPSIRLLTVKTPAMTDPWEDLDIRWSMAEGQALSGFSGVGFYFGRKLHQELQVPIGLIHNAWGGTCIETWIPPEGYAQVPELSELNDRVQREQLSHPYRREADAKNLDKMQAWLSEARDAYTRTNALPPLPNLPFMRPNHQDPTRIYNGRVYALVPFAIKGVIWYQGESNAWKHSEYLSMMRALIGGWRTVWNRDLSFYYVQLANFTQPNEDPKGGDPWALLREAQWQALAIPDTGMAVAIDIGAAGDIHPRNKQDVGLRLARWALNRNYEQPDLVCSGPLYRAHQVETNRFIVEFDYLGGGLMVGKKVGLDPVQETPSEPLRRFALAGEDRKWYWADAVIEGETVVVTCPDVPAPVALRYAFSQNPEGCNLYNRAGLPASPFRTDDWD